MISPPVPAGSPPTPAGGDGHLEAAIDAAAMRLHTEPTVEGRRDAWAELVRLHGLRTAETVARLERERGLA